MPSPNRLITKSLINTFQRAPENLNEIKTFHAKLFDAVSRMQDDLTETYNTVFDGPLAAVDGYALTRLNAASLEGNIEFAYINAVNEFSRGQELVQDDVEEPFWKFGFGDLVSDPVVDPTSYFRIGSLSDGDFFFSQNAFWDGAAWDQDNVAVDSLILTFSGGDLELQWWDNAGGIFRNTWAIAGKEIFCADDADTGTYSFVDMDVDDVFRLGEDCATDGVNAFGYVAIPGKIATEIPPSGLAAADGVICIDRTNNYLVFYHSSTRYRVAGVAYP